MRKMPHRVTNIASTCRNEPSRSIGKNRHAHSARQLRRFRNYTSISAVAKPAKSSQLEPGHSASATGTSFPPPIAGELGGQVAYFTRSLSRPSTLVPVSPERIKGRPCGRRDGTHRVGASASSAVRRVAVGYLCQRRRRPRPRRPRRWGRLRHRCPPLSTVTFLSSRRWPGSFAGTARTNS